MVDEEITNMFNFTFKENASYWCNNYVHESFFELHIYWFGIGFLQMIPNSAKWWTSAPLVEVPKVGSDKVGGSVLWTIVEVVNNLQTPTIDSFLTTMFRLGFT
jgi:hypothetical protein